VSLFGTAPLPGGYCNISYAVDNNPPTLSSTPASDTSNVTLFGALLYAVRVVPTSATAARSCLPVPGPYCWPACSQLHCRGVRPSGTPFLRGLPYLSTQQCVYFWWTTCGWAVRRFLLGLNGISQDISPRFYLDWRQQRRSLCPRSRSWRRVASRARRRWLATVQLASDEARHGAQQTV
jgi:hypothetical protein